jgi:hypothetical protein
MRYVVTAGEAREECEREGLFVVTDRLAKCGPLTIVERDESGGERTILRAGAAVTADATPTQVYSTFGEGKQVIDADAKARIEAQRAALAANGVKVNASEQLFATGTRMAQVGYATQAQRKREHDASLPVRAAAAALRAAVEDERREDRTVTSRELARAIDVNGKISAFGLALSEPAIRGLATRLDSPMMSYVLGLRERVAIEHAKGDERDAQAMQADRTKIAEVLRHECARAGDVKIKLRTRASVGDVFAVVSPFYAPADAPAVLDQLLPELPRDARATWAYDAASTAWELRADVWTPTPVDEQAVGEAFSGYVSFQSRDNGSGSFRGGGGVLLLRCLNASVYQSQSSDVARVHKGNVLVDVGAMLRGSTAAIRALCAAWGRNRAAEVPLPTVDDRPVPLSEAIPGFYASLLRDRSSELAGVLPGRSAEHVEKLTAAFFAERRDPSKLVRSDFAQGWTRYAQEFPTPVRREAEAAAGAWLVSGRPLGFDRRVLA